MSGGGPLWANVRRAPSPTGWHGISQGEAFGAVFARRRQREPAECGPVGKLTTAPGQELHRPPVCDPPLHPPTPPPSSVSPLFPLSRSCCLRAPFHNRRRRPPVLSSQGRIVSLTPCVLCLHHLVEQILPRRVLPSAPLVEFSITSHIHDTLRWLPPWRGPRRGGRWGVQGFRNESCEPLPRSCHSRSQTHTQLLYLCFSRDSFSTPPADVFK